MVKSENAELLMNGKRVENDLTFTAEDSKMEVQIEFTFNASELGGKELVTFEELYDVTNPDEPIKVAEHKDIKDKGQTVTVKENLESPRHQKNLAHQQRQAIHQKQVTTHHLSHCSP